MTRQLIQDEQFTNVQNAQAGLTRLFKKASKKSVFYRVLKNDEPLGVLVPNNVWEDLIEDLEASSETFRKSVRRALRPKKRFSYEEVGKELGL